MVIDQSHKRKFAVFYTACFLVSYAWLFFNHLLFHQLQPVFFLNRLDLTLNLFFVTGIQQAIKNNYGIQLLFDLLYLLLPLLTLGFINSRRGGIMAALHAVFNLVYALLLSSFTPLSIAGFAGWILLPWILVPSSAKGFYFMMHAMRYIFLIFFFSAGLWKIRTGALFHSGQMSAILVHQHAVYLADAPGNWFSRIIQYLIMHKNISYLLYLLVTLLELVFVAGFFTKKYDRWLAGFFVLFVLFDFVLMRINYFAWVAFLGCFWFSRHEEPGAEEIKT